MSKVISIYNNKGGVGKTTTSKYFAKYLAKNDKRVLLVDLDPQSNLTSQFLRSDSEEIKQKNTTCLLLEDTLLNDLIIETENEMIDIVGANISLLKANDRILLEASTKNPANRLRSKIVKCEEINRYDYILIDCPPTIDMLVTNALTASDGVVIPINADSYSLDGIEMLLNKIDEVKLEYNDKLEIYDIFMNMYKNTNLHKELKSEFSKNLKQFSEYSIGDYTIVKRETFVTDELEFEKHKIATQFECLFSEIVGDNDE